MNLPYNSLLAHTQLAQMRKMTVLGPYTQVMAQTEKLKDELKNSLYCAVY